MTDEHASPPPSRAPAKPKPATREDRLKAALKANMARRKTQARARSEDDPSTETE
ncbi:hypothetical protein [Loktanella fryxellensis]|uniref:hypothetical protein n=1 Tax=Loktanella fryxellensis TaxID=245187 RepID=UPI000A945818|nr:hypothetical protein [Loktanella fryxellensis]